MHPKVVLGFGLPQKFLADQGLAHERGVDVQAAGLGLFLDERITHVSSDADSPRR